MNPSIISVRYKHFDLSHKLPTGHPNLLVFLSSVKQERFKDIKVPLGYPSLSSEEWRAGRPFPDNRSIVIKKAEKDSAVVL